MTKAEMERAIKTLTKELSKAKGSTSTFEARFSIETHKTNGDRLKSPLLAVWISDSYYKPVGKVAGRMILQKPDEFLEALEEFIEG
jgi:hypothetical protein